MNPAPKQKLNCAIYCRKSHEEGLEQDYNSLDAQWDAGNYYIKSQSAQGWVRVNKRYEDGGFSGGNLDRPKLKELLDDVRAGLIDVIVVYKMDRLTRSLLDFAKLVEIFNQHGVTFVSVTENFNTTSSVGRLTLNMILSFAQFERELTSERIRDKFTASKKKGLWMGGVPPLGYDVVDRKLVINRQEAKIITFIFEQYVRHGSVVKLVQELEDRCYRGKSWTTQKGKKRLGKALNVTTLNKMIRNPVYRGIISHKGVHYPGEHQAIITPETWEAVQALHKDKKKRSPRQIDGKSDMPYLLKGVIFDQHGWAMTPSNAGKSRRRRYRYYVSTRAIKYGYSSTELRSIPAEQIEPLIVAQMRKFFVAPEVVHRTHLKAQMFEPHITLEEIRERLNRFNEIWDELFPLEQCRIVQLIVKRIDVSLDGVNITYQPNGIMEVYEQISGKRRAS
jgi:site-specific DNA recombinase